MKQTNQSNLWHLYQQTWFARHPTDPLFENFAIITAYNPGSIVREENINQQQQSKLANDLMHLQLEFTDLQAGDINLNYVEPSFAVNCGLKQAVDLCFRYQQNALFWIQQDKLWLIPVTMRAHATTAIGTFSDRLIERKNVDAQ